MKVIQPNKEEQTVEKLFEIADVSSELVTFGTATVQPGERLPNEGTTFHAEDEYGVIVKGDIYTYSGGEEVLVKEGSATFIPRGEEHWCRNDGDEPVEIVWLFVK